MTVREIAASAHMSLRALAARFGIPARTMEDWSAGRRTPPPYVLTMMTECLGLQEKGATEMVDLKYYDQAVELMDDEIREEMHRERDWDSEEEFLREYERRHLAKYGEEFKI